MSVNYDDLDQLIDEQVIVTATEDNEFVGNLKTYKEDFTLTLTGDGQPDDVQLSDLTIEYVDGEKIINSSNVISIEQWDRP